MRFEFKKSWVETYNRVVKYPKGLNAPQVRKTEIQLQVKAVFFQIEFGMIAGFPRFSCRCIQYTNAGKRMRAMESIAILPGSLTLEELPVITLQILSVGKFGR